LSVQNDNRNDDVTHKITIYGDDAHHGPTVLTIFDETSNAFIPAENHQLYKFMKNAEYELEDSALYGDNFVQIQLKLDKEKIAFHESLQVSLRCTNTSSNANNSHDSSSSNNNYVEEISCNNFVSENDIVAFYCSSPKNEEIKNNIPEQSYKSYNDLKLKDAATIAQVRSSTKFHSSRGQKVILSSNTLWYIPTFPIIREDECFFRLWKNPNGSDEKTRKNTQLILLSTSTRLKLPSLEVPTGIRLSLTNDASEMVVQFTTGMSGVPIVQVVHPHKKVSIYRGQSTTYTSTDMCQYPANSTETGNFVPPGNLHTVLLNDLVPDKKYQYRVGLETTQKSTKKILYSLDYHKFLTSPTIGSDEPFSFIAYGDQGCPLDGWGIGGNYSAKMIKRELDDSKIPIRAVHHFGDLSYARGHAHLWDDWLGMISVFTTRVPLLVGVGNHEYDHTGGGRGKDPSGEKSDHGFEPYWGNFGQDSGGECGIPVSKRFFVPENGNGVFWYSYDLGLVHTIMISSEHSLSKKHRQYKWIENDLQNINRTVTPWIVVESHRPLYMGENQTDQIIVEEFMRREFESLLIRYNVDLFLAGHYHSYLRTCDGLYKSKCNNGGMTHITVGTAGARLDYGYHLITGLKWTEKFLLEYGYGKVTVYNSSTIHWSFISSHGDYEGEKLDEVWIRRPR